MTIFFPNETIIIFRSREIGSSNRFAMSATFTPYQTDIQPASPDRVQQYGSNFGALFTAFIDATVDIKEGDQVHTEDGKVYSVKGVQTWQGAGLLDHKELVLVSQDG